MKSVLLAATLALTAGTALAQEGPAASPEIVVTLSPEDREAIISGVVTYFKNNPGELVQAVMSWRQRSGPSYLSADDPTSGNAKGDVTAIEFADVGCAACREVAGRLARVAASDGGLRVVHKDYPVSGPEAVAASLRILAASRSGGSRQKALDSIAATGRIDAQAVDEAVRASGAGAIAADALASARDSLERNRQLAARIGIKTLPAVVLLAGDKVQVLTGNVSESEVLASVAAIRQAARMR